MVQIVAAPAQQKDNLCGPFCVARILNELGFDRVEGEQLDEDLIAYRAGASLPHGDAPSSLPPGAVSRTGYRYRLPMVEEDAVGTSPAGLMEAIESASGGEVRCIAVRGPWDARSVERLVEESGRLGARLIANLRTGRLWGSRPRAGVILGELAGEPAEDPSADWDVGHFVELEMVIRGPKRSMMVVRDTYPSLGWEGRHLQPPRVIAAALRRGDGREGGVLVVVPRAKALAAEALPARLGLVVGTWNNGCRSDGSGDR